MGKKTYEPRAVKARLKNLVIRLTEAEHRDLMVQARAAELSAAALVRLQLRKAGLFKEEGSSE